MVQLIQLIDCIVVFAVVAYGIWWVCTKFGLPQPIVWVAGVILRLILLIFAAQQLGLMWSAWRTFFPIKGSTGAVGLIFA